MTETGNFGLLIGQVSELTNMYIYINIYVERFSFQRFSFFSLYGMYNSIQFGSVEDKSIT